MRSRWTHVASGAGIEIDPEHGIGFVHFLNPGEEADHSIQMSLSTLENLRQEISESLTEGAGPGRRGHGSSGCAGSSR